MNSRHSAAIGVLFAALLALFVSAAPSDPPPTADEKALKDANVPIDSAGLLEFFQKRSLDEATRKHLAQLIKQLGDDEFDVREKAEQGLIAMGPSAEPAVRRAAADGDPEIVGRAKRCLAGLGGKSVRPELIPVAVRVLAQRSPPETATTLLAYLPSSADALVEEEVLRVLERIGVVAEKAEPVLVEALRDPVAIRRLAAAKALARLPEHRPAVRTLLTDGDHRVRLSAAAALLQAGEKNAVATLIALVGDAPADLVWQAEELLCRVAGDQAPLPAIDPANAASREKCRAAWVAWWKTNEATIDLAKAVQKERELGLTVICDFDGGPTGEGMVWECGSDGKERWRITDVQGPDDVQVLPGARLLIAEHNGSRVTERTRDGKVIWEHRVNGNPVSCQRLANGNTFIATYTELLEVTREGRQVFSHPRTNSVYCAQKLPGGQIAYVHSNGHVVELDGEGKDLRSVAVGNTAGWGSLEALANGHYLVALYNSNKVKEIDTDGKVYFDAAVPQATFATRLSNGNTLVADTQNHRIVELNALGKEVWKLSTQGRPFRVRRR